jgi:outer membrane protein OmpA-like peptidoglycan-associated protein
MDNNQSSYARWTWIIAILLALILLWMLLTGKGSTQQCCQTDEAVLTTETSSPSSEETPTTIEIFSFSANESDYTSNGTATEISWVNDIEALKALLSGGISAEGDATSVLLRGSADSEEAKQKIGVDAQAFFGPDTSIDNQITVVAPEPVDTIPAIAKLYFDSGVHRLPVDGNITLEPTITWLNNHPDARVIISGYHDPTGDLDSNQKLAKKRAQSTLDALVSGGISTDRIEMRKPESTQGGDDLNEARRVEVSIE